jgi:hypothetical protein
VFKYSKNPASSMKKDFGWVFGLLETEKKELTLCEMYDLRPEGIGSANVDWKQLWRDRKAILHDLEKQIELGVRFTVKNNRVALRRMKRKK